MDPGPLRDALTLLVGLVTGVASAALGVGGAVVSTPGIRLLGASAFVAVGTTLPSILPSAVSGGARYSREGLVAWSVVRWAAPMGMAAAVGGSLLSHAVPGEGHVLMVVTALLLGTSAARMFTRRDAGEGDAGEDRPGPSDAGEDRPGPSDAGEDRPGPSDAGEAAATRTSPLAAAVAGAAGGGLSGLLGVGGGIVLVPAFTELLRLPTKVAVATSLVCVGILAVPGTVTHALLGDIDWRFAGLLCVAVVPGARLGAALALRMSGRRLRRTVAVVLGGIAVAYGVSEVVALVR